MQWNRAYHFVFDGKSMETEIATWSDYPNGGKVIVEQILAWAGRKKSKRARLWHSQSEIQVEKLIIWVKPFETEKLQQSLPGLSAPPN